MDEDPREEAKLLLAILHQAIRDSLRPAPAPYSGKHESTMRWVHKTSTEAGLGARNWIKIKSMDNGPGGFGFGYTWWVLDHFEIVNCDMDTFIGLMERMWKQADANPSMAKVWLRRLQDISLFAEEPTEYRDMCKEIDTDDNEGKWAA